jgi:glycosyltransferase involved in cell wall biosynthesis
MMRPEKGHRELVEVAARLQTRLGDRPWELWLAGDGSEREPCHALARRLGVEQRIRFLGQRDDADRLLAAADIALLASRSESLPNFLVEAQWTGLPVAACDVGGVAETFLPDASGVLVASNDIEALALAAQRLATDTALRERMSTAAREHARATFDPAKQNQRYLDLFAKLLAHHRPPP